MKLPFLDRREEARRLRRLLRRDEESLGVLYGRRRCGKSRILDRCHSSQSRIVIHLARHP